MAPMLTSLPGEETSSESAHTRPIRSNPMALKNALLQIVPTLLVGILIVVLDQAMKAYLGAHLLTKPEFSVWLLRPVLKLRLVHNSGFIFGVLSGSATPWVITAVVALAILALLYMYYRQIRSPTLTARLTFGLTLGGAVGNLVDRFRFGYVVDFVDLGWWPVFNIADASINISIVIFLLLVLVGRVEKRSDLPSPFTG